jgi:hypothetical protein
MQSNLYSALEYVRDEKESLFKANKNSIPDPPTNNNV